MGKINKTAKQEKELEVANRVQLLFTFAASMKDDLKVLKDLQKEGSRKQKAMTLAPIIGAMGGDLDLAEAKGEMEDRRLSALINLIETLFETNDLYQTAKKNSEKRKEQLKAFNQFF